MAEYTLRRSERNLPQGVNPEMHKSCSLENPIISLASPTELLFPIHFSGGGPGKALISAGDRVLKGTPIIKCNSGIIHAASRSGVVKSIEDRPVVHPSQSISQTIVVDADESDRETHLTPMIWPFSIGELSDRAQKAGVLGLGGAGFPSFLKWSNETHTLIVNGAECEPYLTADESLMRHDPHEMIRGASILAQTLSIDTIVIGIEDNKLEALAAIEAAIIESTSKCIFDIVILKTKYPSGAARQLIWLTLGIEIPTGTRSVEKNILVHNPNTLAALSRAVDGKPVTERIVTLTGDAINKPQNFITPIGTPIHHLIQATHTESKALSQIIIGGPMMGFRQSEISAGITKLTNCILAKEATEAREQPCIRCGACASVCPVYLQPQQLFTALKANKLQLGRDQGLDDCIECAACNSVCPSHIPLAEWFRKGHFDTKKVIRDQIIAGEARARFEARKARLDKIKLEREARRTARRASTSQTLEKAKRLRKESPL